MAGLLHLSESFMPHGHCYLWLPEILWLHVISDALIAAAYFSIPVALGVFVSRRRDLQFRRVFLLFVAFILWCGLTHLMSIWVVWHTDYFVQGIIKAITAAISLTTAALLWPLIPQALAVPSPADLRRANEELRREVARRERAEQDLRAANGELRDRVAELESLTQAVSRELRGPLRTIEGFCDSLIRRSAQPLGVANAQVVHRIKHGATGMQQLIEGLLTYLRLGRQALHKSAVDMNALARSAAEQVRAHLPHVTIDIEPLPPAQGDSAALRVVWEHLLGNAAKFSAHRADARVLVTARTTSDGDVHYCVTDNGIGFEQALESRLYSVFQRFSTDESTEGAGLGLAIVRRVAERHGGSIEAKSAPGQGAEFTLRLPAARSEQLP